jgi:AbiV family abortive infection protein
MILVTNGDQNKRVIGNAKRLLRDAALLNQHGGHASAFALAVLGLEEIGKAILRLWDLSDHRPGYLYHLSKQRAVSSLLMVDAVVHETQAQAGRGMVPPPSSPAMN